MKFKENSIELTIQEAIELLGAPKDIGNFGNKLIITHECLTDILFHNKLVSNLQPEPVTEKEIEEWKQMHEYLDGLDWEAVRKRVVIIKDDYEYE